MASVVEICNLALRQLGARRITSLGDSTEEARASNDVYERLRDDLLRAHPWNFATVRTSLAALSTAPSWGYDNAFQIPVDSLRILEVSSNRGGSYGGTGATSAWEIESSTIVSNLPAPLNIKYIKREEDPNVFDSKFINTLAAYIAWQLAERLTQSNTKRDLAKQTYQEQFRIAKFVDAQESTPKQLEDGSWLDSRNYGQYSRESWEY